jgi:hypothetical protein
MQLYNQRTITPATPTEHLTLCLQCHENLTFCVKVSMLEIYNEVITDLLNPSGSNLQIREDIKRGCYVEDLSEQLIQNGGHPGLHQEQKTAQQYNSSRG